MRPLFLNAGIALRMSQSVVPSKNTKNTLNSLFEKRYLQQRKGTNNPGSPLVTALCKDLYFSSSRRMEEGSVVLSCFLARGVFFLRCVKIGTVFGFRSSLVEMNINSFLLLLSPSFKYLLDSLSLFALSFLSTTRSDSFTQAFLFNLAFKCPRH